MRQKALAHLANEGPWLVTIEGDVSSTITALQTELGQPAVQGWLSSYLPDTELAQHLSNALLAQTPDGRTVLLRSYSPRVMPALHARTDYAWHSYLFGPINSWWITDGMDVQQYTGGNLTTLPDYQTITLDAVLLETLGGDQQALALLEELEKAAAHIFTSDCHGERLSQVEQALAKGRASGLKHSDDQRLFATLALLEGRALDQSDNWQDILTLVNEQPIDLGQALERLMDENDL